MVKNYHNVKILNKKSFDHNNYLIFKDFVCNKPISTFPSIKITVFTINQSKTFLSFFRLSNSVV